MTRIPNIIVHCAAVLVVAATTPALAFDTGQSAAGGIDVATTPCMIAKYKKQPCPLPALADVTDSKQQAAARIDRAKLYIDTGELPNALVEADEALRLTPNDVDIRHLVARLALTTGDSARAEREIKLALQQRPDDANLQATDAARLIDTRPDQALPLFDRILSAHPDHRFSREARARLRLALGLPKEAVADLDFLVNGGQRNTNLLALRGKANVAAGHPQQAVADLTEAMKEEPRLDLVVTRAIANEILGDDAAALEDYNTILGPIGSRPNYAIGGNELARYRMQRALVAVRLKRFGDAAAEAVEALNAGGRRTLLKAQVFLRQNGFPDVALDGQPSEELKKAMQACMGLNSCFEKVSDSL
ncbi:tetratricopeptide repeat protein [Bradyrhizobium sp. 41S5]|uniref:tetratricopeptide repeat protein n=1 Tax=Bradyrhizobium sp. 41S5 TaxID=1404443 RepID=UPI00156A9278|nr:tetratricopeptide repeat protein [Bradyrhizobium sp. 41S5]UFX48745.1 tetratricopeptide repeat protein [Bradyrhizobium sp. 41S5]